MKGKFLCVGDLDVDLLVDVDRLPGLDDKVSGRRLGLGVGGMAANVAVGLARLGSPVRLVALVGDDEHGEFALRELTREGVETRFVRRLSDTATFMCVVFLTDSGEKSLVRLETDAYLPAPEDVTPDCLVGVGHVHLTLGSIALSRHCAGLARTAGASVSLDLELADLPPDPGEILDLLGQLDWLFINRRTYDYLLTCLNRPTLADLARRVIVTLGGAGCRLETADSRDAVTVPGHRVAVRDSTGAGDAFAAAFLHYHLGMGLDESGTLRHANAAAALSVGAFGAQAGLADARAVTDFLANPSSPS